MQEGQLLITQAPTARFRTRPQLHLQRRWQTADGDRVLLRDRREAEGADSSYVYSYSYTAGYSPGDGSIQLSNNPAMADLTNVTVGTLSNGNVITVNVLADMEQQYGQKSGVLTPSLFWAMTDLHELGHVLGGMAEDSVVSGSGGNSALSHANTDIVIESCFKELLK